MPRVDHPLVGLRMATMPRDLDVSIEDHNVMVSDENLDRLFHEPVRNAVSDRVDVHEAVCRHSTCDSPIAHWQWPRWQWPKSGALIALEPRHRRLVCRAMHSLICLDHPTSEVCLERREACERETGDHVSLHIANPGLGLAFGARAKRSARRHLDAPVFAERSECRMHPRRTGFAILTDDERASSVD
jgi:hypothetical protein